MKSVLRLIISSFLGFLAACVVRKYRPVVVMVTGSVGKTSTKDAVAAALTPAYYLRKSEKSYNSEFGVPLSIIGAKNPWNNPIAWVGVIEEALALIFLPSHYPKLLVLEVGADRPGDLSKILKIATPDAVVVTHLPSVPVHVEAYATPEAVRQEEFTPATALPPDAPLIVSADDGFSRELASRTQARTLSFGFDASADIKLHNDAPKVVDGVLVGMAATVTLSGKEHELVVPGVLGRPQLYAPAAALALALALGMDPDEALGGLATYAPPPGRNRLFRGKNHSLIIDDSYNSSPAAVIESLAALSLAAHVSEGKKKRTVAILGDMLELGRYSVSEHERIGATIAKRADILITVGVRARAIADKAEASGMKENAVVRFDSSLDAARSIPELIKEGDSILVKGSQSIRMERIVAELLQDPGDQKSLVRQEYEWKRR